MALEQDFKLIYTPDATIKARAHGARGRVEVWMDFRPVGDKLEAYPKGVYDPYIFGDMEKKKAAMRDRDFMEKWGYIDLGFYTCFFIRKEEAEAFLKTLKDVVWLEDMPIIKQVEFAQFNANGSSIIATAEIDDHERCGWDGLVKALIEAGRPEGIELREKYLNRYLPVTPVAMRPISRVPGSPPRNHADTQAYRSILWELELLNAALEKRSVIIDENKGEKNETVDYSEAMLSAMMYHIRKTIDVWQSGNKAIQGGKVNFSRSMQNNRIVSSGRAVIIPDPTLRIDEVGIPVHLAYEMCDKWFTQYLQYKDVSFLEDGSIDPESVLSWSEAYDIFLKHNKETMKMFQYYVDGLDHGGHKPNEQMEAIIGGPQLCYVNRQPTLHQLSMLVCKMRLTYDSAIKYPIGLCSPLNA